MSFDEEELAEKTTSDSSNVAGAIIFVILFFPAIIFGLIYYLMLRKGHLRISVIAIIALIVDSIALLALKSIGGLGTIIEVFKDYGSLGENWSSLITPLILVSLIIGSVFGLAIVAWDVYQMRKNPWKLTIPSSWMYNFRYRKTPWQMMTRKKNVENLKSGSLGGNGKAPLGIDEDSGKDNIVYRYDGEAIKHSLITGLPGSGKTVSMLSMIKTDIEEGKTVVGIDFKRDPELASKLATWSKENGRNFYHFVNGVAEEYDIANSPGQSFYNPLAAGTPTSNADMLLSMREYDAASAVYKAAMTQVLQIVFNMLYNVTLYKRRQNIPSIDWQGGGFYTLVSAISGNNLTELAQQCEGTPIETEAFALANAVQGRTQEAHAIDELRGQLRTITASEYGPWLKLKNNARNIDLFELTKTNGNVVLFSLNSDSEPEFAKYMGAIILSDLTSVSAKRRNDDLHNQVHVYVDEFQVVNPESIKGLLEKSRASSLAITLAQQSLEQIIASSDSNGEAYLGAVLDTCGNFVIHFGATEPSAIRMAEILGKDFITKYRAANEHESFFGRLNWSNKRNQRIMMEEEERWLFSPIKFMQLDSPSPENNFRSSAIVVNKTSFDPMYSGSTGAKARKVWMIPDKDVLKKYYTRDTTKKFDPTAINKRRTTDLDQAINSLENTANQLPNESPAKLSGIRTSNLGENISSLPTPDRVPTKVTTPEIDNFSTISNEGKTEVHQSAQSFSADSNSFAKAFNESRARSSSNRSRRETNYTAGQSSRPFQQVSNDSSTFENVKRGVGRAAERMPQNANKTPSNASLPDLAGEVGIQAPPPPKPPNRPVASSGNIARPFPIKSKPTRSPQTSFSKISSDDINNDGLPPLP